MPQYDQFIQEAHINTIRTSAPVYMKGYADLTKRNFILFNLMSQWGTMVYNASGTAKQWQVLVYEHLVKTFSDTTNKVFHDHDAFETLTVGVRGYETNDVLRELQWKENQGEAQLINLYESKRKHMAVSLSRRMQEAVYRDGDSAAYKDGYQGFETALGALNASNGGSNAGATDRLVLPKDSYGGHSTELGNFGGSWSTDLGSADRLNKTQGADNDWPFGQGDSEYDALSPTLWNYDSSDWGSDNWSDNCETVVRHAIEALRSKNGTGPVTVPPCFLISSDMYAQLKNYYSSRFRTIQPFSGGDQGFPIADSIEIDGAAFKSD